MHPRPLTEDGPNPATAARLRAATLARAVAISVTLAAGLLAGSGAPVQAASPAAVACDARTVQIGTATTPRQIAGTYCRPARAPVRNVIVMVPGGTYNRSYWDFSYMPGTYSFARASARAGYAAFAIDRLGTGASSKPLSVSVTLSAQARAIHELVEHLRDVGLDGATFDRVLLAGHSAGSTASVIEAGTYQDVDAVIVTGLTHGVNLTGAAAANLSFHPAALDPRFADLGLDLGYVTTRPGARHVALHDPGEVDPGVIEADEATKDVLSLTEVPEVLTLVLRLDPHSDRIAVPILLAIGGQDAIFCGSPPATDCASAGTVLAAERPEYGGAPCVNAIVMPGAGHSINLHPSAPSLQTQVLAWADAVIDGACPGGWR